MNKINWINPDEHKISPEVFTEQLKHTAIFNKVDLSEEDLPHLQFDLVSNYLESLLEEKDLASFKRILLYFSSKLADFSHELTNIFKTSIIEKLEELQEKHQLLDHIPKNIRKLMQK